MTNRRHPSRRRHGFTLIESMAAITILAVSASIASFLILDAVEGYTEAGTSAQLHAELSIALDRVAREIRKIELDAAAATPPGPDITSVETTHLQWQDSGGLNYQVAYDGSDKVEIEIASATLGTNLATLLTDVSSFSVQCYDKNNGALPASISGDACDDIRRVAIAVGLTRDDVVESLRAKVFIRSTMDGAQ